MKMPIHEHIILTGPIHSGKTSALQACINRNSTVAGILCPDKNGLRMLYDIGKQKEFPFQSHTENAETTAIGKYIFLNESFRLAQEILLRNSKESPDILIVDEIGKLELNNKGLEPALSTLIRDKWNSSTTFVLVIRDYLLDAALQKYKLKNYQLIEADANGEYSLPF